MAGSAYTYAYATLGELIAWIIGWDLVLEYAIGSAAVANGWSSYFIELTANLLGIQFDPTIACDALRLHSHLRRNNRCVAWRMAGEDGYALKWCDAQAWFNVPAVFITVLITAILIVRYKREAGFNAAMVILNIGVILSIVGLGSTLVDPANWHPFLHKKNGLGGRLRGSGEDLFRVHRLRLDLDPLRGGEEPQRDLAIGIIASLFICTVLYVAVAAVLTGMVPYAEIDVKAPLSSAFERKGYPFATMLITLGILAGLTSSLLVGTLSQPRILLAMARDGMLPESFFAAVHPRFRTPWKSTILVGVVVGLGGAFAPLGFLADLVSIGTLFAFSIVCGAVWLLRVTQPRAPPALPRAVASRGFHARARRQRRLDVLARQRQLDSFDRLAGGRAGDLFRV